MSLLTVKIWFCSPSLGYRDSRHTYTSDICSVPDVTAFLTTPVALLVVVTFAPTTTAPESPARFPLSLHSQPDQMLGHKPPSVGLIIQTENVKRVLRRGSTPSWLSYYLLSTMFVHYMADQYIHRESAMSIISNLLFTTSPLFVHFRDTHDSSKYKSQSRDNMNQ
jgi:hypothetical protein